MMKERLWIKATNRTGTINIEIKKNRKIQNVFIRHINFN